MATIGIKSIFTPYSGDYTFMEWKHLWALLFLLLLKKVCFQQVTLTHIRNRRMYITDVINHANQQRVIRYLLTYFFVTSVFFSLWTMLGSVWNASWSLSSLSHWDPSHSTFPNSSRLPLSNTRTKMAKKLLTWKWRSYANTPITSSITALGLGLLSTEYCLLCCCRFSIQWSIGT